MEQEDVLLNFSIEGLGRLDPEIRVEHISNPDGTPGMKFYKTRCGDKHMLVYSPELFLVLRLDDSQPEHDEGGGGANRYSIGLYSYNEQLIQSWFFQESGSEEEISHLICKFLNSGHSICPGLKEDILVNPLLGKILIERYRDSIVYRSRGCTRIIQDYLSSAWFDRVCSECDAIAQDQCQDTSEASLVCEVSFKTEEQENFDVDYDYEGEVKNVMNLEDDNDDDEVNVEVNEEYKPVIEVKEPKVQKKKRQTDKKKKVLKKGKKNSEGKEASVPYKATRLRCEHGCNKSFNGEKSLEVHMIRIHTGPLRCPVQESCELRFQKYMEKRMILHIQTSHMMEEDFMHSCSTCGECLTGVTNLLSHAKSCKREHSETTCEQCGLTYKTVAGLYQHIKIAHQKVRFYCDEPGCEKEFKTKNSMINHKSCVHGNARAFICSFCGKDYKYRHERRVCENKHAGRFLHHCHLCDKKFNIKRKLEQHIRVHTGEKPYGCPVCAYRCARLDNLNTHTKKSHGMTYKQAESVTGISASTTNITIVPPPAQTPVSPPRNPADIAVDNLTQRESGVISVREPLFINCDVVNLTSKNNLDKILEES